MSLKSLKAHWALVFICLIGFVQATQANPKVETTDVKAGFELNFHSKILDQKMNMSVFLPESFDAASPQHTYPVIFINGSHGYQFFLTLSGVVHHLSKMDRMPESIIVSLNDSGHFPKTYTNGAWGRASIGGWGEPEKYLKHLQTELFPYLKKHYRANDHRLLIGVSGSSLFPMYSMIEAPGMFYSYMLVASADMLGMGYRPGDTVVDDLVKTLKAKPDLKGLLYAVNSDDDIYNERQDYRPNFAALNNKTKPYVGKGFKVVTEVIENERHYDVFIKAALSWFEHLYPEARWAPKYRDLIAKPGDAMDNIDAFYHQLSDQYGFTILPKANRWNSVNCLRLIARQLRRDGRLDESLKVAKRAVTYRSNDHALYNQLAQTLDALKQHNAAVTAGEKAVQLAKQQDNPWALESYEKTLKDLKAKL